MKNRWIAAAAIIAASTFVVAGVSSGGDGESVCPGYTTGHLDPAGSYTAPEGKLISAVCVKAGSEQQGEGPEITNYDPPVESVTISHSSGKDVSHFSVLLVDKPDEDPEPTTTGAPTSTAATTTTSTTTSPTTTTSSPSTSTTSSSTSTTPTTSTTPSTTSSSSVPPPTGSLFSVSGASTTCIGDAPFVVITFGQRTDLNDSTILLEFLIQNDDGTSGEVIDTAEVEYQAGATITLVYPGATVDEEGNPTDWPGWMLNEDGFWVTDPSDAEFRNGLNIVATALLTDETATAAIEYPPETEECANPPGPFGPGATTTTLPGATTTTVTPGVPGSTVPPLSPGTPPGAAPSPPGALPPTR